MKKSILALMFLLVIGLALAVTPPETIHSRPNITFTYEEQVYIKSHNLTDDSGNEYALEVRPPSDAQHMSETFVFQPINHLMNKQYSLEVVASDFVGNIVTTDYTFIVNAPFMWIKVTEPPLGVSKVSPFNVTIQSQHPAYCKYGFTASGTKAFPFYQEPISGSDKHYLRNVGNGSGPLAIMPADSPTDDLDTYEKTLYLECNETLTGRIHPGSVIIGYDPNAPGFRQVKATPNPVIDIEEPWANLTVLSNDKVICKYNDEEFPDYDINNVSAYKYFHTDVIDYTDVKMKDYPANLAPHVFNYNITCRNRAGMESTTTYTVTVDLDESMTITMLSPGEYTNQNPVIFKIETGVQATGGCLYSENNGASWLSFDPGSGPKIFTRNLGPLAQGTYTYKVKCVALSTVEKTFTIRVDRTPPGATTIKIDEPICSLSELEAEFDADDNATGIGYYNYSILYDGDLVVPWSKSTDGEVSEDLDLEENETYKWQVKAVDKAGNIGALATKEVKPRNPNRYLGCDETAPSIDIKSITRNGSTFANVTCTDAQSGCKANFKYSLVAINANCTPTTEKSKGYLILVNRTSDVCAIVFDNAGNNKTLKKKIVVGGSCNNGVKDANETAVDCGGDCQGCGINKTCNSGDDCASNNCINHKCAASGCNDGAKDGDETDVDCGGSCDPCALNKRCEFDVDCMSGFCHNGTCKTPTCSDSILNQGEGDIDCGGPCTISCANGKTCRYNTDCQSGNCINYVCADPTCTDGVKNGNETDADCGGPDCPRCELGKDCSMNSDCESRFCENYSCAEKQFKWSFWMLIIGIVLFGGGLGYMAYSRYFKKEKTKPGAPSPRIQRYTQPQNVNAMPAPRPLSPEELKRRAEAFERAKQVARERALKRRQQRSDIMKAFGADEKGKTMPQSKEKEEQEEKKIEQDEETGKPKEGFIPLGELGKASKKSKSLNKQDLEEDVFQKLKAIGPEEKPQKKLTAGAKKTQEKKTQTKKKTAKPTLELKPPSHPSGLKPSVREELSEEDVFQRLAELTGQTNDSVKKAVDKDTIKKDDMMNIFANVTEKKQLDMDVFKAILSTLLGQSKIDKKEVSSILFEFFDKQLLTKKELYDTLKELKLV